MRVHASASGHWPVIDPTMRVGQSGLCDAEGPLCAYRKGPVMGLWVEHVIWWHVYPLGFVGAEKELAAAQPAPHRLSRLHGWLDHLVALGCNGLALGPILTSATHGYDTTDYFRIDPRLGDEGDFAALVAACRERGIRVLLDGVFNHAGRDFPPVRDALAGGSESAAGRWIRWSEGHPYFFEGHDQLVALNHEATEVQDLVAEVMTQWLERGADAWRLDAAYAVPPEFWARVLPRVRGQHPGAWFSGEVIHGDFADIVRTSTMDSVTQYELWQGIWHGIADRNFFELAHALKRHNDLLATFVPSTFVGNHDVTRIASAVGTDLVPHALAVLFTVAGVPSVYAGDEFGYTGVKEQRLGGDAAVRPEFPSYPPDVDTLDATAGETLRVDHEPITLRRRRPWLLRAHTDIAHLDN